MIEIKGKEIKKISSLKIRKVFVVLFWFFLVVIIIVGIRNISYNKDYDLNNNQSGKVISDVNSNYDVGVNTFSSKFIKSYFSFSDNEENRKSRLEELKKYMIEDLVNNTLINIEEMKGIKSSVTNIEVWNVERKEDNNYKVDFTVYQELTMQDKKKKYTDDTYYIVVHKDNNGNYVVIQSPTVTTSPKKGDYELDKTLVSDTNVTSDERAKIDEFLNMFFNVYPKATDHELTYYVEKNIKPLGENLELVRLENEIVTKKDDTTFNISIDVIYKDLDTNFKSINHFDIVLINKDGKFIINSF
ncbi:conjugal transfer protein [Clostridium sp. DSM 100503]|uniref:conjugal transfer protein n=1 Tax=Clostridium sp. DSM 100503 TaxID=2963282 RepID=UPI00214A544E|nr:conjugal transfer protein [Clostridium sp. DSM 100503]MCR1953096.1 conjugal transfer protein [Clostridium sp. DSM 100503]